MIHFWLVAENLYLLIMLMTCSVIKGCAGQKLYTYLLHGTESFLRSQNVLSY
jgi:hypothetical protein